MPPIWYRLLAHLSQMKDLLFVCRYVEPFRSYEFAIDGRLANFVAISGFFSPAKFFLGSKIKISKHVLFFPPQANLVWKFCGDPLRYEILRLDKKRYSCRTSVDMPSGGRLIIRTWRYTDYYSRQLYGEWFEDTFAAAHYLFLENCFKLLDDQ